MVWDNESIKILRQNYNFEFDLWGLGRRAGFHNGYCITKNKKQQIIINKEGQTFIFSENIRILECNKHFIFRTNEYKYGLINIDGTVINQPIYNEYQAISDYITGVNNVYFCIGLNGSGKGVVDTDGMILIKCQYRKILESITDCFIVENMNRRYGIIDINNNPIIPFIYLNIFALSDKFFTAKAYNKLWGLYDYENNTIIQPQYQSLYFYDEYGIAKLNNKWGIIDRNNKSVTGFIFDDMAIDVFGIYYHNKKGHYRDRQGNIEHLRHYNNTKNVYVKVNNKWATYSLITGKPISLTYSDTPIVKYSYSPQELIPTYVNKLWGFANTDGKMVIPPIFDEVRVFKDDRAMCCINNKWGIVDKTGKQLPLQPPTIIKLKSI